MLSDFRRWPPLPSLFFFFLRAYWGLGIIGRGAKNETNDEYEGGPLFALTSANIGFALIENEKTVILYKSTDSLISLKS